ncbi:MAG: VRR-NUC domain-containing protein [Pseudomonadota bacterium]
MKPPVEDTKQSPIFKTKEKPVEKTGTAYAQSKGWLVYKFVSPGNAGVPDRVYFREGKCVLVEWKRPSKNPKAKKRQEMQHNRLRRAGMAVYLLDDAHPALLSMIFD